MRTIVTLYAATRLLSGKKPNLRCALQHDTLLIENQLPFTDNKDATGLYACAACGTALFEASKKFEAGCGFPSFWLHLEEGVKFNPLNTYGRERIQLLCKHCGNHLGHLFPHKHTPTGVRYCISRGASPEGEGVDIGYW